MHANTTEEKEKPVALILNRRDRTKSNATIAAVYLFFLKDKKFLISVNTLSYLPFRPTF